MQITHSHILLDACCVLNFCASGQFLAILKSLPAEVVVTTVVQEYELKTLQSLNKEDNDGVFQFEEALKQKLLMVVDFESEQDLQILSTSEIIKNWSEQQSIDSSVLSHVLNQIRIKGHYAPPKNDPLRNWWQNSSE